MRGSTSSASTACSAPMPGSARAISSKMRKAESKPATRVSLCAGPAQRAASRLGRGIEAYLRRTPIGRRRHGRDAAGHQRVNADMPDHIRQLLNAPAFALQELRLVVVSSTPKGIVHIDGKTAVELLPEYKVREGRPASAVPTSPMTILAGCATRSTRCARWSSFRSATPNCSSGLASIRPRAFCSMVRPEPARPCSRGPSPTKVRPNSFTLQARKSWDPRTARASGACARFSNKPRIARRRSSSSTRSIRSRPSAARLPVKLRSGWSRSC